MPALSTADALAFIASAPRTGKLATVRKDGSAHVVPVWVAVDGDEIVFNTGRDSAKAKAMVRDPRVSLCFDDETPPFTFVTVAGTVTLTSDPAEMLHWATIIGGRYMGADRADEYGRRNAVPEEVLVRVTPTRVVGVKDIAD